MAGDATPQQQRNMSVCSQLHEVHRALLAQVPKLPPAAAEVLCDALEHVQVRPPNSARFFSVCLLKGVPKHRLVLLWVVPCDRSMKVVLFAVGQPALMQK